MKTLGWIVGIVLLLVVGVGAYVVLNSGSLVKTAIEELGPDYLGVDVSVGEVNLALSEGTAQVKSLNIGNPQGFGGGNLMKLGEVKVVLDTSQISDTLVVMKQVVIDGADVAAVAKGQRTNFQQLLDNLESSAGGSSDASETVADSGPEIKFIIDSFAFTNARASLASDILGELALELPDIRLQNIGRKTDGATAAEITEQLIKPISAAISQEAVNQGLDVEGVKQNVKDRISEEISGGLRSLTDKFKK